MLDKIQNSKNFKKALEDAIREKRSPGALEKFYKETCKNLREHYKTKIIPQAVVEKLCEKCFKKTLHSFQGFSFQPDGTGDNLKQVAEHYICLDCSNPRYDSIF